MESLVVSNTKFSLDLFSNITEHNKMDNVFYSPISISFALAMVYMGARGNTATEMSEVLHFMNEKEKTEADPGLKQQGQTPLFECLNLFRCTSHQSSHRPQAANDTHAIFRKLMSDLNRKGAPYALSLANRLYGEKSFKFEQNYIQDTKKFYEAQLETVDFISKAEDARLNINRWVEKQTEEKIKNFLTEGAVDHMTRLVLVNAIYFKADWDKKFKGSDTKEMQFKLNKNESKPVQMMHQTDTFGLATITEVSCQILEMPYEEKELSMLILLPQEIEDDSTGLARLERELTYEKLIEWTLPNMMDNTLINVGLPKLKMEETYNLKDILVGLGMKDAFDLSRSDFSGMSPSDGLVVSKVVHKAFVEVNEEGTEAAAASAVLIGVRSLPMPPPAVFIADHPFLFFIRHNPTQSILFYGRFCSP